MATHTQSVTSSVNRGIHIGFSVTTSDATSTAVITAAQVAAAGATTIREIYYKLTLDDAFFGLGITATKVVGLDIVPIIQDDIDRIKYCKYTSLNVIRSASTNVNVTGYVVVN